MIKLAPTATYVLCDRCSVICSEDPHSELDFINVPSRHYGKGAGQGRMLHFCTEECQYTFLRGKTYWNRKRWYKTVNHVLDTHSDLFEKLAAQGD